MKEYWAGEKPDKDQLIAATQRLAPILEIAFLLDFKKLKKIANVTLQIPLYCEKYEENVSTFKRRWNLHEEDLTPQRQRQIMEDNQVKHD